MPIFPPVVVKRSSAGLGLYTTTAIKKGTEAIEYTGEIITTDEADTRGGKYLASLNKTHTIDGKSRKNLARYINHACIPNCFYEVNEDETKIFAVAKKNIPAGSELTVHYGKDYFEQHIAPHGCKCSRCTKNS